MAIKHKILARNGKTIEVLTHPARSMKLHCLECLGWSLKELSDCGGSMSCSLFHYNKYDKSGKKGWMPKLTPLKTIRRECLSCGGGSYENVEQCKSSLCNLFLFRMGKDPSRTGKTNRGGFTKRPLLP